MFNKLFLFYLPKLNKYYIVRAKDESEAVHKLCGQFTKNERMLEGIKPIKRVSIL